MNKFYIFSLVCILFLTTGCFSINLGKKSIEDMISESEILDLDAIKQIANENKVKLEDYEGKTYVYTGKVNKVEEYYAELYTDGTLEVYLDKEVLKKLESDEKITVIGTGEDFDMFPKLKDAKILSEKEINKYFYVEKKETTGSPSKLLEYSKYEFNKDGTVKSYYASGKGLGSGTHSFTYDKNKNVLTETIKSIYDVETKTYEYNSDNTVKKMVDETKKGSTTTDKREFTYKYEKNDKGLVTKKTEINISSNYTMVYTYQYDKDDKVTEETQTSPNSTYKISYTYDKFGHMIEENAYNVNEPSRKIIAYNHYGIVGIKKN